MRLLQVRENIGGEQRGKGVEGRARARRSKKKKRGVLGRGREVLKNLGKKKRKDEKIEEAKLKRQKEERRIGGRGSRGQ